MDATTDYPGHSSGFKHFKRTERGDFSLLLYSFFKRTAQLPLVGSNISATISVCHRRHTHNFFLFFLRAKSFMFIDLYNVISKSINEGRGDTLHISKQFESNRLFYFTSVRRPPTE